MTPLKLIAIITGLALGHLGYLEAKATLPAWQLWAAHKLVDSDLEAIQGKELDKDKSLLLCLKQLEDWQDRAMAARELLEQEVITSADLKAED